MNENKFFPRLPKTHRKSNQITENKYADLAKLSAVINDHKNVVKLHESQLNDPQSKGSRNAAHAGREHLSKFLTELGISPNRTFSAILSSDRESIYTVSNSGWRGGNLASALRVLANMQRMLRLEAKRRGSVRYFYEERGIRNFARFTEEFWLRQYDEKDSDLPYTLTILPCDLEDEAMSETEVYTELQDKLKGLSKPHLMRMIEIKNISEGLVLLNRLTKRYNAKGENPIPLVIYDGHGTEYGLYLEGSRFGPSVIHHPRFEKIFNKYLRHAFTENAEFVFGSCYAGNTEEGVGLGKSLKEALHEIFSKKIRVVASAEAVTQFAKLNPRLDNKGTLSLDVKSRSYGLRDPNSGRTSPLFRTM